MAKRISSRDDLFLSAVDMYTLLSMVFIGAAFMASAGAGGYERLDLPVVRPSSEARPPERQKRAPLTFTWYGAHAHEGKPNETCQIQITYENLAGQQKLIKEIPCWPSAFGGFAEAQSPEAEPTWGQLIDIDPQAVIYCPPSNTLQSCARLQWVVAEHGFRTAAAVHINDPNEESP